MANKKRYIQDLTLALQDEYTAIIKDHPYIINGELNMDCPERRALINELYDRNDREQRAESNHISDLQQQLADLKKQIAALTA